jgi:histidinol dehydrogenase
MKKFFNPSQDEWPEILKRPTQTVEDIEETVNQVFAEVKAKGNAAVSKYTELFDGINLENTRISEDEVRLAESRISEDLKQAIQLAKRNIEKFHTAQKTERFEVETTNGVICWQEKRPIQKVGLYIPGGSAPLFSTILMLAAPANIAGYKEIVLCTPPDKEGNVHPAILYTAALCGVTKIFKILAVFYK